MHLSIQIDGLFVTIRGTLQPVSVALSNYIIPQSTRSCQNTQISTFLPLCIDNRQQDCTSFAQLASRKTNQNTPIAHDFAQIAHC